MHRPVPEDLGSDIEDRDEALQPDLTEAERNRKTSGEARAARDRDNTYHGRKCKLAHLTDHLTQELWDAFLERAARPRVEACSERGVLASLGLGLLVRGLFTIRVADPLGLHDQPVYTDIPPNAAVAAVLAAHPDLRARLAAIPRHPSDTNMVDHVGKQLETAFSNMLTLLFVGRLKKSVSLAGAKVLVGTEEHRRRFGFWGVGGGYLPAWSKRECTYVRRMVCGLDVTWLLEQGGVVPTPAMQAEVALQRGLLGLGEGELVDHAWVEDPGNRGRLLRHAVHTTRGMEAAMAAWQLDMVPWQQAELTNPGLLSRPPRPPTPYALTPTSKCQARHVFIDTRGVYGMMHDAGMLGVLTEEGVTSLKKFRNGALPDPARPGNYIEGPKDSHPAAPPAELPRMGKALGAVNPLAHLHAEWLGVDPGKTNMATVAHEERSAAGTVVSVRHLKLTAGQYYRDNGITRQAQATKTWLAKVKPQLTALSRVSSKPISLASYRRFADTVLATYDAIWAEVKKQTQKRWPDRILALAYGAASFSGSGSVGCRGVPVSQMRKEAVKQFGAGCVVLVEEFRTSRVSSAYSSPSDCGPSECRWLRPVYSKAKRSQVRGGDELNKPQHQMPSFARVSPHLALSVYTSGSQVLVQPKGERGAAVSTLSVDLASGSAQHLTVPSGSGPALEVLGVVGLCKLHSGSALLLITAARKVGMLEGADLFLVTQTKVLAAPSAKLNSANRSLLSLLEEAVHPCGAGRGLYFSYFHDLTLTTQRAASLRVADPAAFAAQLPVERADSRFFWNKVAAAPLIKAGAARFVQPCILGFVQQLPGLQLKDQAAHGNPVTASLTLIARRSTARSGVRQWRRGADAEGNVANFAETEQILAIEGPSNSPLAGALCSYLILRGSIPLLWTQLPNIKYKPSTLIAPAELSSLAHDKHFHALVEQYKGVVAINLINHHGTEGKLEVAFRSEAARLTSSASAIARAVRYIAFDFHAECGNKRYHRLSLLWDQISADFTAQGFLRVDPASGAVARQQGGVVRVNCIDCLDRTNVVQGVLARKSLEAMLASLGLLPSTREGHLATLPEAYPEQVEREFKILWADHGDALSTQYAGTGAMKSGFTRTGKRTTAGALDDGVKAVVRYYLNNYQDGRKQDALDLLTGAYQPDGVRPPPLRPQPSPLVPLLLGLLGMSIALYNLVQLARYGPAILSATTTTTTVLNSGSSREGSMASTGLACLGALLTSVFLTPTTSSTWGGLSVAAADHPHLTTNTTAASAMEQAAAQQQQQQQQTGALSRVLALSVSHVLLPFVLGLGLFALIVENGKHLVNKPLLCPQLAVTVDKVATSKGHKGRKEQ
ncbi:hypothetical protein QJQ45_022032 [Haematococcus lacustris]|nr:hypothetical protein QJQ45_022032 [Haematococcus lacustris]